VKSSTFSGNAGFGVYVTGASATIGSSTASGNGMEGIRVFGDGAAVSANRAEANGFSGAASDGAGLGIDVVKGSFTAPPAGTNVARGDDDPADCDPFHLC
jgi:hypothetical protein